MENNPNNTISPGGIMIDLSGLSPKEQKVIRDFFRKHYTKYYPANIRRLAVVRADTSLIYIRIFVGMIAVIATILADHFHFYPGTISTILLIVFALVYLYVDGVYAQRHVSRDDIEQWVRDYLMVTIGLKEHILFTKSVNLPTEHDYMYRINHLTTIIMNWMEKEREKNYST